MRLIAFAFLLLTIPLLGQTENDEKGFSFLIQAGLNASQVGGDGDGLQGFDKLNLAAGLGVQRFINEKFDWRLEINLLQKGSRKAADPENGDITEYKMSLLYAQVPVLIEYKYNEKISLLGGPGFGFLMSSKEKDAEGEIANTPEFNTVDFSLILSAKYQFSDNLGTEIRFDQSLLPIRSKGSGVSQNLIGRQFNTVVGIFLSYSIN